MWHSFLTFVLTQAILLHGSNIHYYLAFRSSVNQKLQIDTSEKLTVYGITVIDCVRLCAATASCRALNIGSSDECEILKANWCDGRGYLVSETGFHYYDIGYNVTGQKWNERQSYSCKQGNRCSANCRKYESYKEIKIVRGNHCVGDSECLMDNGECANGACRCKLGYSYNPQNDSCSFGCEHYSDDYNQYKDLSLAGHNTQSLANTSLQNCLNKCSMATFTCRSVDFNSFSGECFMSDATCLQYPNDCITSSLEHYSRNCR